MTERDAKDVLIIAAHAGVPLPSDPSGGLPGGTYVEHDGTVLMRCTRCGAEFGIGCSPFCRDGHAPVRGSAGYVEFHELFQNYYDEGLDVDVTGRDHRRRVMRDMKVDYRERPSKGDLSARRDKMMEKRQEQMRA